MDDGTVSHLDWEAAGLQELPEAIALRRAIHMEPELGLHLPKTTAKLKAALAGLPLELREHLWIGVGLGTDYQIEGWSGSFHGSAHNFPLHTAIQYGVPALLAWLALWALLGWRAWRCRGSQLGLALLLLWVFPAWRCSSTCSACGSAPGRCG